MQLYLNWNKIKTLKSHFHGCKNLSSLFLNSKIKKFIQIGSSLEYGKLKSPHIETLKCKPTATYGISKYKSSKYIQKCDNKKVYICPATAELAGADIELYDVENRENILKKNIDFEEIKDFDFIIIDCPPSLSLLSINALSASNAILVPIQCEFYAMEGLVQLNKTINLVRERINENLDIEGFVLTMFDSRNNICKTVVNEVKNFFGDQVMKTIIPKNVKLAESPSFGKCIFNYDKYCLGSKSYMELSKEIILNNGGTYIEKISW